MSLKIKKQLTKLLLIFGMAFYLFAMPTTASADFWLAAQMAAAWKWMMEQAEKVKHELTMTKLKEFAIKKITEIIREQLEKGLNGEPMWIVDWEKTLYDDARDATILWMKDYLSSVLPAASSSNYISSWNDAIFGSDNYINYLKTQSENLTINAQVNKVTVDDSALPPSQMFDKNNFQSFTSYAENNIICVTNDAQEAFNQELLKQIDIQGKQSIAYQGYQAQKTNDGMITEPGISASYLNQTMINFPFNVTATATTPGEVLTNIATQAVMKIFSGGSLSSVLGSVLDNISILNDNGFSDFGDASDWIMLDL